MIDKAALKINVETLAKERNATPIQIITQLQSGAAIAESDELLDALCDLKWEYIG